MSSRLGTIRSILATLRSFARSISSIISATTSAVLAAILETETKEGPIVSMESSPEEGIDGISPSARRKRSAP